MTANPDNYREHEEWTTVAVTALPTGWRNVYRLDDGTLVARLCPALLLQENRRDIIFWDQPVGGRAELRERHRLYEPPYATRVVYAEDDGPGWLEPVQLTGNYIGTVGPGEDPNILVDEATP